MISSDTQTRTDSCSPTVTSVGTWLLQIRSLLWCNLYTFACSEQVLFYSPYCGSKAILRMDIELDVGSKTTAQCIYKQPKRPHFYILLGCGHTGSTILCAYRNTDRSSCSRTWLDDLDIGGSRFPQIRVLSKYFINYAYM